MGVREKKPHFFLHLPCILHSSSADPFTQSRLSSSIFFVAICEFELPAPTLTSAALNGGFSFSALLWDRWMLCQLHACLSILTRAVYTSASFRKSWMKVKIQVQGCVGGCQGSVPMCCHNTPEIKTHPHFFDSRVLFFPFFFFLTCCWRLLVEQ